TAEVADVSDEQTSLEQILAAGKVFMPRFGLFPPGLGAIIMDAPRTHGHAGPTIEPRLVGEAMNHETVHSGAERRIAHGFDGERVVLPARSFCIRGERFGGHDRFAPSVSSPGHGR